MWRAEAGDVARAWIPVPGKEQVGQETWARDWPGGDTVVDAVGDASTRDVAGRLVLGEEGRRAVPRAS